MRQPKPGYLVATGLVDLKTTRTHTMSTYGMVPRPTKLDARLKPPIWQPTTSTAMLVDKSETSKDGAMEIQPIVLHVSQDGTPLSPDSGGHKHLTVPYSS